NGAIKPCQRPSQKPATPSWFIAVPLDWLGPGAHVVRGFSNSKRTTSKVKEGFIGNFSRIWLRSPSMKSLKKVTSHLRSEFVAGAPQNVGEGVSSCIFFGSSTVYPVA